MCNISVLSEMSFHNNEILHVNAKMVKLHVSGGNLCEMLFVLKSKK